MNKTWLSIALFATFVMGVGAAGCKQDVGERCQTNHDCASGVCSMSAPKVCVVAGTDMTQIDATLPPDAAPDAPVDAAVDMMTATGN